MKQMRCFFARLLAALVCAAVGRAAWAGELAIQSFDRTGRLTFNALENGTNYLCRIEWAPSPAGPWTNTWKHLAAIPMPVSGVVTCSVPMCYRVMATVVPDDMVLIPGGTNTGADPDFGYYSLTVETFFMGATEVTKAQWDAVYAWAVTNGYGFDNDLYGEGMHGQGKAADHPVHTVNWYDCAKWCNARSQKEGRTPCYTVGDDVYKTGQSEPDCNFSANGYRLPTMTEWEYAARGGLSGRRFPWGDTIDHSHANYYSDWDYDTGAPYCYDTGYLGYDTRYATGETPYTSPAGAFAANGYGLYDMSGNVWEWCNDGYGSQREYRGGSWNFISAYYVRCGHGSWDIPYGDYADDGNGFRAVCR